MKYYDGMGKDVTEYVHMLEQKIVELQGKTAETKKPSAIKEEIAEKPATITEESGTISTPKRRKTTYADTEGH